MAADDDYRRFVAERYGPLVRAAVLLGAAPADAEDAAQDALTRCYVSWARVRGADDPEAYAYRVLVNGLRRGWRRRWRGEVPHAEPPEPAAGADHEGASLQRTAVQAALGRLRPDHRQVVVLRFFADLSESRTAAVLGVPAGTVKSRTSRALALLAADPALAGELPAVRKEPS
ncbi:SigE family RNA polymerase sigma factor [Pseudonocardia sp. GCM10023141]|uniref:SigE family RNA polymerase sigma factor n=1 Tax=Pseudonocardia sp. GCM10023141 TaxID=3252653 RepID=UPI00360758D8